MTEPSSGATAFDIGASAVGSLQWNPAEVPQSLGRLLLYVEAEAGRAIGWYWRSKRWKARLSRWIRLWALTLTASAGLVPIVLYLLNEFLHFNPAVTATSGLWSSPLVGLAASLVGLDRAFGFSSGWARYVLAATEIRKRLEDFRMDWVGLLAAMGDSPTSEQIAKAIKVAKDFRCAVEGIVLQETKDWVTEFQSNMAQLEKDVKASLDSLRRRVEKAEEAHANGHEKSTP